MCTSPSTARPLTHNSTLFCARNKQRRSEDLFHVRFAFDRTPFRRMHAALAAAGTPPVLQLLPKAEENIDASHLPVRAAAQVCFMQEFCCAQRPVHIGINAPHTSISESGASLAVEHGDSHGEGFRHLQREQQLMVHSGWPGSSRQSRCTKLMSPEFEQATLPAEARLEEVAATLSEHGTQRLNAEQRRAVAAMLCSSGDAIYALNGPPGTGKTVCFTLCCVGIGTSVICRRAMCMPFFTSVSVTSTEPITL